MGEGLTRVPGTEHTKPLCLSLQSPTRHTPGGLGQEPLGTKGWSLPGCSLSSCQEFRPPQAGLSEDKLMIHHQMVGGIARTVERQAESRDTSSLPYPASTCWRRGWAWTRWASSFLQLKERGPGPECGSNPGSAASQL